MDTNIIEKANTIKALISAAIAAATAIWGWFGWLVLAFIFCMLLDFATGTISAAKKGEWYSQAARKGIKHKLGSVVAVTAAGMADMVIGILLPNIPLQLPFSYTVAICPLVLVWYIMVELGSILENAQKLGAPVPYFLKKYLMIFEDEIEKVRENSAKEKNNNE